MELSQSKPLIPNDKRTNKTESGSFRQLLFAGALGAGAVMVLSGLQWFQLDDPLDLLRSQLRSFEKHSLKQARKADENSAERDKSLDKNNKLRLQNLSAEVLGECRANFDILSQQIHCLTQIALQTLTTLSKPLGETPGGGAGENQDLLDEIEKERRKVIEWSRNAQEEADKLVNIETVISARKNHVETWRSEIPTLGEETDVPISVGPRILKQKKKDKRIKWTASGKASLLSFQGENRSSYIRWGIGCLGCTALLGSMYAFSSPANESSHV